MTPYEKFIYSKSQSDDMHGISPLWLPDFLFDFQKTLVDWSLRKGRAAIFADCGLGKTPMQLVWAENIIRHTNKPVLIVAPLAVSAQTVREAIKFNINCKRSGFGNVHENITVTNYERLHYFDPDRFSGIVCDESSAIKHFGGANQKTLTEFTRKIPYRLLCTATASPNDYIELGTSSEALGELGRMDMLSRFFKNDENSLHPIWWGARWRFKAHGERDFWRWVCSWARAVRRPSDIGFADEGFILPPLTVTETIIKSELASEFSLFPVQAVTLDEQRSERRATMVDRCQAVADCVAAHPMSLIWCHLNDEADMLEKMIPGARQIKGADSDDDKERTFLDFANGDLTRLITKPRIGALGLNFQNCAHMTFFPSHSFEQYYQGVRRCWRYGQKSPVTVDIITTEGELGVQRNLQRKADAADKMFDQLVKEMNNATRLARSTIRELEEETPSWL